jgi:hypothetical protein
MRSTDIPRALRDRDLHRHLKDGVPGARLVKPTRALVRRCNRERLPRPQINRATSQCVLERRQQKLTYSRKEDKTDLKTAA